MINLSLKTVRRTGTALALVLFLAGTKAMPVHAEVPTFDFNIPAENTAQALTDFSRQAGVQILYPYDLAEAHRAPAIIGKFTRAEVLARLLKGTGLEISAQTETSITLRAIDTSQKSGQQASEPSVTEVIVTGSHIRGGNPTSPVHTVNRKDIEKSGYSQVGDLVRSLPENFSGGQNPGVMNGGAANFGNQNATNASTVNLRGLGTDATLVLLNGHRMAADGFFQASDVTGIPLSAVQRVEVVTDGASAIYGSDAVAGVVNFILRKNYSGGEVSARIGGASQGGGAERTFNFMNGGSGKDWYWLANVEYSKRDGIDAGDRKFTSNMFPSNTLLRPEERRTAFVSVGHELGDRVSLSVDGLVSDRKSNGLVQQFAGADGIYTDTGYTPSYSVSATVDFRLPRDWKMRGTAVASGSRNFSTTVTTSYTSRSRYKNFVQYGEVIADGTLFALASGPVKAAVGGGYRQEGYQQNNPGSSSYLGVSRDVSYFFGEVLAPLVMPSASRPGLHELEVSASARTERYSDFGGTTNPRVGIRYVPLTGLTVRTTWGKSFKAPSFVQMFQPNYLLMFAESSFGGTGTGTGVMTYGGNPSLKPEKSKSWTLGADFEPGRFNNFKLSATYFNIDYTDRVVQPVVNSNVAFTDATYAPFVNLGPTPPLVADLVDRADVFINLSGQTYDPANVVGIVYNQYQNATAQAVEGVDVAYSQTFDLTQGSLGLFANATWLTLDQQTIVTVPSQRLSGTIYNAPKFKARVGMTWQTGGLVASGIVNFISGEDDTGITPYASISSWTTTDATIAYGFSGKSNLNGVRLALSAINLFDAAPPLTVSPISATEGHFDSTNASIVGRFVALTLSKAW